MNGEVLFYCLSKQPAFMCAVSNERQFICILNHPGIGCLLFYFYLFFSEIKQHRLKLCVCGIQCALPPFPPHIIPLVPSEQKTVPIAMHAFVRAG